MGYRIPSPHLQRRHRPAIYLLALLPVGLAGPVAYAAADPHGPPPPPPLTTAPDPNRWLKLELEKRYPGRAWGDVSADPDSSGFSADYTLTEPEYLPWTQAEGPGGEDLRPLRQLRVAFKIRCREPGEKGRFTTTGISQQLIQINSAHSSGTNTVLVFDGVKDTPATSGATVGTSLSEIRRSSDPFLDVRSAGFAAQYRSLVATMQLADSVLPKESNSKESLWAAVVTYPHAQERVRISIIDRKATFLDATGQSIGGQTEYELGFAFIPISDRLELVLQDRFSPDEATTLRIEEIVAGPHPFAFDRAKQRFGVLNLCSGCRFILVDASTMRVSGPGIPETTFRRTR